MELFGSPDGRLLAVGKIMRDHTQHLRGCGLQHEQSEQQIKIATQFEFIPEFDLRDDLK
jgi:hypothetical protein